MWLHCVVVERGGVDDMSRTERCGECMGVWADEKGRVRQDKVPAGPNGQRTSGVARGADRL